jgi:hypothetical protein
MPASTVTHVLCATELTSGQPLYMSREMVLSPLYGQGVPKMDLARAIYASAAFPIGFPPLRVRTRGLKLAGGHDDEPPKRLYLSDGGVFNNLGTETFAADRPTEIFLPDPTLPIIPRVDRQLVVNASAPPGKVALPGLPGLRAISSSKRIMSVLYENTVRPRVQRLMNEASHPDGPIVVDIAESPIELVDRLSEARPGAESVRTRAADVRSILGRDRSDSDWKRYADRAARTKTVLSPLRRAAAVRLVRLGYLDTAIACHAHLATQGVRSVPGDRWFSELVDDTLTDDQLTAPATGNSSPFKEPTTQPAAPV